MPSHDDGYSFVISVADFDKTVLPSHARTPGTDEFSHEVSQFFQKEFAAFKGRAQIIVDAKNIEVSWQSDPKQPHPMELVRRKLEGGKFAEAVELLEKLRRYQPDDVGILYSLGMALSDLGQLDKAEQVLRHAVNVAPDHVNARVALGVALARQGRHAEAIPVLREAVTQEPTNPWAHRNLGGCLMTLGEIAEAETSLRRAVELNPADPQSLFGLAQVLRATGEPKAADDLYIKVIALDERSSIAEKARQERTKLSQQSFRAAMPGMERPDAVMYCLSALQMVAVHGGSGRRFSEGNARGNVPRPLLAWQCKLARRVAAMARIGSEAARTTTQPDALGLRRWVAPASAPLFGARRRARRLAAGFPSPNVAGDFPGS